MARIRCRFFQRHVFDRHPQHWANIPRDTRTPLDFYRGVVRYYELSAWSEEPPLILSLLSAFKAFSNQDELIGRIRNEGPFRCHPPGVPFLVARVAAEAPLLDRKKARLAALGFDPQPPPAFLNQVSPKRVLRVKGDGHPGLPSMLSFFRYPASIQPEKTGVLYLDFGSRELLTQAASENTPIELLIARDLERQVRLIREDFAKRQLAESGIVDELGDFYEPEIPYAFEPLNDLQQRTRWTRQLATDFVEKALYVFDGKPQWWVAVFDNCKHAPADAQEFVRRLVELAARVPVRTMWNRH